MKVKQDTIISQKLTYKNSDSYFMLFKLEPHCHWPKHISIPNYISETMSVSYNHITKLLKFPVRSLPIYSFVNRPTLAVEDFER